MRIDIYIDDLKEEKKQEILFALRDILPEGWFMKPIATIEIENESEF